VNKESDEFLMKFSELLKQQLDLAEEIYDIIGSKDADEEIRIRKDRDGKIDG